MDPQRDPATPPPLRIVIVDADHRVRRDLAGLVELGPGLEVAGTAATVAAALELVAACEPDVVVIDPRLPDIDAGLGLIGCIHERMPGIRVVVMSCAGAVEDPAFDRGAHAFVTKNGAPAELLDAIAGAAVDAAVDVAVDRRAGTAVAADATLDGRAGTAGEDPA